VASFVVALSDTVLYPAAGRPESRVPAKLANEPADLKLISPPTSSTTRARYCAITPSLELLGALQRDARPDTLVPGGIFCAGQRAGDTPWSTSSSKPCSRHELPQASPG
jgi:hypothetical protein